MGSSRVILSLELHSRVIDKKLPEPKSWKSCESADLATDKNNMLRKVDNSKENFDHRSILDWNDIETFIWHEKLEVTGNKEKTSK